MSGWAAVLTACAAVLALKLAGHLVPAGVLARPRVLAVTGLLPAALLAALVAVQTTDAGGAVVVDARAVGLAAAVTALVLRAPFLVVLLVAAAATAGVRAAGWAP